MFDDDVHHPLYLFGLVRCSFDRYVLLSACWDGFTIAIAASSYQSLHDCSDARTVSVWLLVVGCLQALGLLLLGSLRDRRLSLQLRWVFVMKATQTALALLDSLALLAVTVVLTVHVSHYFSLNLSSTAVSPFCPSTHSLLLITAALAIPLSFIASVLHLVCLLFIVYHRLVFNRPPTKTFQDDRERDAITWVRSRTGAIIPTLLIVPPSVDLSRCEAGVFPTSCVLLYSHGNAMDLSDSIYVLRAFAESFDCACLGYEYVGYGMCAGSASEDECNAAIEAAYECLIAYHHAEPSQIILYGRSLGTGPSTHLAHLLQSNLGGLVLQSAMQSVLRAALPCLRWTLWCDMFASCDLLSELTLPVLLLHGERDTVVRFSHAQRMYELLSKDSRFPPLWVADGTHDNMPKPWIHSREKSEKDSEERYTEKMRVNERNETYITRMKEFILHCHGRAQHMQAANIAVGLPLPTLQAQKEMLEQQSNSATVHMVHPELEVKVADDGSSHPPPTIAEADAVLVSSPLGTEKHAIFGLSLDVRAAETSQPPQPSFTPLSSLSRLTSLRSPPLSAATSAITTPRGLYSGSLTPSTTVHTQPPLISLPSSLPLFSPPPLSPIPSPHALDDDSPPSHIRSQSATAAVRASSRLTSFPRSHQSHALHRRAITANTVAREAPAGGGGGSRGGSGSSSAMLERLMTDETTTEIRLVREHGAVGGWRVEREGERGGDGGRHSRTEEAETRATLSAAPRGSFSDVARLSRSARETAAASVGGEEKDAAESGGGKAE